MGMVIPLEGHLQIYRGEEKGREGKRVRGEERENYLPYFLTYLTERFASPDRQTDRPRLQKESRRERENEAFNLVTERVSPVYIYI